MWAKAATFVNLFLAGALVGNEVGTWVAVHPALGRLSGSEGIRAEKEITVRYGRIMPFWMSATIVSCLPVLAAGGRRGRSSTFAGMLCFAAMLAVTLLGNVPINERILDLDPETDLRGHTPHGSNNPRHRRIRVPHRGRALPVRKEWDGADMTRRKRMAHTETKEEKP